MRPLSTAALVYAAKYDTTLRPGGYSGRTPSRRCSVGVRHLDRTAFETKSYPESHLKLRFALGVNRAAYVLDLEPVEMAQCLARFLDCVAHGLVDALSETPTTSTIL